MKLFIFDLDGTLVAKGGSIVLPETIEALKMIKDNGDLICIATGRCSYMIPEYLFDYIDYIVSSNGQVVSNKSKIIYENYLSNKQIAKLEAVYNKYHTTYNYKRHDAYHIFGDYEKAKKLELKYNKDFEKYLIKGNKKDKVYISFLYEENESIVEKIKRELSSVNIALYRSVEYTYDVMDKNISKASGIKILCSSIPSCTSYGFGDGENDYEFLKLVDNHYVLGDGNPNLINKMTNIIGPSTSNAIYEVIKDIYGKDC